MLKPYYFLLFLLSVSSYAQDIVWTIGNKEWIPAVILKSDQSIMTGLIQEFGVANTFEVHGPWDDFRSIESLLHLDQKIFNFKKDLQSESQKISIDELRSITLLDADQNTVCYDKVKLKAINSKMEVLDLNRVILAPVRREGKINLYAIELRTCEKLPYPSVRECQTSVISYIRNPNDEFAFIPLYDVNLFNLGSIANKMLESFRHVSQDCPEFQTYLNDYQKNLQDKEFRKQVKARWQSVDNEKKEALKTANGSKDRRKIRDVYLVKRYLTFEMDMIEKYESICK